MLPILAVDLGGTNMRVASVGDDGTIVERDHAPTPDDTPTIEPFLDFVAGFGRAHDVDHAVVAVPGRVDHAEGTLLHSPNLPPAWVSQITRDALADALDLPVMLENDADVAAVGEAYFGAGVGHRDMAYLTVSTGVGAGIVIDGQVLRPRYSGGEVGHTVIDRGAAREGRPATVEGLGSGTALARAAREQGLDVEGRELVERMQAGDDVARAVWDEAMEAIGLGVANMLHLVAPTVVVIGGGVGRNGELVLGPIRAAIERHGPKGPPPEIVEAALGDDSGLVGAAAWARATSGNVGAPKGVGSVGQGGT